MQRDDVVVLREGCSVGVVVEVVGGWATSWGVVVVVVVVAQDLLGHHTHLTWRWYWQL